ERHDPERYGHLRLLREFLADGGARDEGGAQITAQYTAHPAEILREKRLAQAHRLADRFDLGRARLCAGDELRHVTGEDPEGEEDDHARHEEPRDQQGPSSQRVADHPEMTVTSRRS